MKTNKKNVLSFIVIVLALFFVREVNADADPAASASSVPHTYTVQFDANGGSGFMPSFDLAYGRGRNLSTNSFTRPGYTFIGWSKSPNAETVDFANNQRVVNLTDKDGGIVTLYAVWEPTFTNLVKRFTAGIRRMVQWIPPLLLGARVTVGLTAIAIPTGMLLGIFIALGKMSKNKVIKGICTGYTFFFRGTPLLMQIFFIYYALPMVFPALTIHNRFLAAYIAYGMNSAAYLAEIIRAAIQSIDKGQLEASRALGLSYAQAMKLVIIPQSFRRLIPPVGNEFILMLKDTALVGMIALADIARVTRTIQTSTASPLVYIPALILYLIITAVFTSVFSKLEKKYSVYE